MSGGRGTLSGPGEAEVGGAGEGGWEEGSHWGQYLRCRKEAGCDWGGKSVKNHNAEAER